MGKCCWDSCHLMTDSKSLLAEKIAQIIKEKPISSLEMDTIKNPIGKNWSSLSTIEKYEIEKICKNEVVLALQTIELLDLERKIFLKNLQREI